MFSQIFALAVALLVVASGAFAAQAVALPQLGERAAELAQETAFGFNATFGDIPYGIVERIDAANALMRTTNARVAADTALASARAASPVLTKLDFSLLRNAFPAGPVHPTALALVPPAHIPQFTFADVQSSALGTYAFLTSPARMEDALAGAYIALGTRAYDAITASFAAYQSLIVSSGPGALALGAFARDTLAKAPYAVSGMNLALGESIIHATHAAIRADVAVAYGFAAAAPISARATVALVGGIGDTLAGATARTPALATTAFLRTTQVPATLAPALAQTVFSGEYAAAIHFVAITNNISEHYLALVSDTGGLAYAGTAGVLALANLTPPLFSHAPAALENTYLGLLGNGALALNLLPTHLAHLISVKNTPALAAVLPALSAGEQAALFTYQTIHGFFTSATSALAGLFGTSHIAVVSNPPSVVLPFATSTTPASAPQPVAPVRTERVAVTNYPTYTTVVQGVSQDFVNQSLASLRANILATVAGMIQPVAAQGVTNQNTIQYVNMIQDLSNLTVHNGNFLGGTFDGGNLTNGISVSATSGSFTHLTGGNTSLATTSISGSLTTTGNVTLGGTLTAGSLSVSGISSGGAISAPYFTATSSTATSTFSGSLNIDNGGFLYATSTRNVGIGVLSPAALLALQNSTSTQPIFVASNAAGAEVYRITNAGFVGIGTTSPTYALSVEGSSSLGNNAIAGYFSATSSTATSTFAGALAVGTSTQFTNGLFAVGTSSPLLYIDSTTGRIGIGTSSPAVALDIFATDAIRLPVGTTAQRPLVGDTGYVRYNTTTQQFEGYGANGVWQGLGGVIDANQDTKITADTNNLNEDYLRFFTDGVQRMTMTNTGLIGIGSTSPFAQLSLAGNAGSTTALFAISTSTALFATTTALTIDANGNLALLNGANLSVGGTLAVSGNATLANATTTNLFSTTASSTNLFASNAQFGSLNANSLALLAALPVTSGGTGWNAIQSGTIPYGNGTSALATTSPGTVGNILALLNGIPTWTATTTFSSGLAYANGNVTNTGVLSLAQTYGTPQTGALTFATSTQSWNGLTLGTSLTNTLGAFTFTPSVSGTLNNSGLTNSTIALATGSSGTDVNVSGSPAALGTTLTLNIPTASASNRGALSPTDWSTFNAKQAALTFTYPLVNSANVVSTAFGTTTANSFNQLQQFNGNASTTQLTSTGSTYLATGGGNVGIGTTSPSAKLAIDNGMVGSSEDGLFVLASPNVGSSLVHAYTNYGNGSGGNLLNIANGNGSKFLINNSGNIGIGTTNPNYNLDFGSTNAIINGNTALTLQETGDQYGPASLTLENRNGANGAIFSTVGSSVDLVDFGFRSPGAAANIRFEHRSAQVLGSGNATNGEFQFLNPSGPVYWTTLGQSTAYFTQNVGIGDQAPGAKLSVIGNAAIGYASGQTAPANGLIVSGNVGIGTTSPYRTLSVAGSGVFTGGDVLASTITATSSITAASLALTTALPVTSGGTGVSTFSSGQLLYGAGTGALQSVATSSLAFSGPFTSTGTLGTLVGGTNYTLTLPQANSSTNGYLSSTDWNTFNSKQSAIPGTTGQFPYFSGTNTLTATSSLFLATNGNVGIGTTSPGLPLQVYDTAGNAGIRISSSAANTTPFDIRMGANLGTVVNALTFYNPQTSTRLLTLTSTGNLSVGTNPNGVNPAIISATGAEPVISIANTTAYNASGVGTLNFWGVYNSTGGQDTFAQIKGGKENTINGDGLGYLSFWTNTALSTQSEKMRITSQGNVGIGTTTPLSKLAVSGSASVGADYNIAAPTNGLIVEGNVGIGTTSPSVKLEVAGDARFGTNSWLNVQDTGTGNGRFIVSATGSIDFGGQFLFRNAAGTTQYAVITGTGNVGIGTTNPAQKLDVAGNINTSAGSAYLYNNANVITASTTLSNYFFGGAGNLTMTGNLNTASGYQALLSNTTGYWNTASGYQALSSNTTGYWNTANGVNALLSNTTGFQNTATGRGALYSNTTGYWNTANGTGALYSNTTGIQNAATGQGALYSNTTGSYNTATGQGALYSNTTGSYNTASGYNALYLNTTGNNNTANGTSALLNNTSATSSVALGYNAAAGTASYSNQGGTYLGYQSGYSAATGSNFNTLLGYQSGYDITSGTNNLILGTEQTTGGGITTGTNNILIGTGVRSGLTPTASNQLNIGNLIFATGLGSEATASTGNVGIGTTSPSQVLSVQGNGLFSGNLTAANITATGALAVSGAVSAPYFTATNAAATSTFAGGFVAGLCVEENTLLKIRRRRKKRRKEYYEDEYDYLYLPIKDVRPGDEVLSLDQDTNTFVYRKIKHLLDTGVQKTFRITLKDGRSIETTARHPYLVRSHVGYKQGKRTIAFIDYANIKSWARSLKYSVDLKVLHDGLASANVSLFRFYYGTDGKSENAASFFHKIASFGYVVITKAVQYFSISFDTLLNQPFNMRWLKALPENVQERLVREAKRLDTEGVRLLQPKANFDVEITTDALRLAEEFDHLILFSGDGDFVSLLTQLHALGKTTTVVSGKKYLSGELMRSTNTWAYLEHLNDAIGFLKPVVGTYKKPQPALRRVWEKGSDSIADLLGLSSAPQAGGDKNSSVVKWLASGVEAITARFTSPTVSYLWKPVSELVAGQEIGVMRSTPYLGDDGKSASVDCGLRFDRILKIEEVGEKQMYDIEVEGTHNFIAGHLMDRTTGEQLSLDEERALLAKYQNDIGELEYDAEWTQGLPKISFGGIVAHNTAFTVNQGAPSGSLYVAPSGNVGIGTTLPAAALQVASGALYVSNYGSGVAVPGGGQLGMYLRGSSGTSPFGFSAAGSGNINSSSPLFFYSWVGGIATKLGFSSYDGNATQNFVTFDYTTGNVGIGTTNPAQKLDVAGNINTSAGSAYMYNNANVITASTTLSNYFFGGAGNLTMTGNLNIASGKNALAANTTGYFNLATGFNALAANTTGYYNVANGIMALYNNTTGTDNIATGYAALDNNTTGTDNIATGFYSLLNNSTGSYNIALGTYALWNNITGSYNTAVSPYTLASNTTGSNNTANGANALNSNTTGSNNTANGANALSNNASATSSVAIGFAAAQGTAAYSNQGGTYLGFQSGYSAATGSNFNTLLGYQSGYDITTGTNNIVLGTEQTTGGGITTGTGNILIGTGVRSGLTPTASNQLNIGNLIFATGLGSENTASTGNVGIGTSSPLAKLAVDNGMGGTSEDGLFVLASPSVGSSLLHAYTNYSTGNGGNLLNIANADGSKFLINNSGNVGIGTSTPSANLSIYGYTFATLNLGSNGYTNALVLSTDGSGNGYVGTNNATGGYNNLYLGTINRTQQLSIINATGNVGIGTTNPAQKLDVAGNINTSAGSAYMYNGANVITASTTLSNYFFGGAGNLTMTGNQNTALGAGALIYNTTGYDNTAVGLNALSSNTTGGYNVAIGVAALSGSNSSGTQNIAVGPFALTSNTTGYNNTAVGAGALQNNTTGYNNTASGVDALFSNTTGSNNTLLGYQSGFGVTSGARNVLIGQSTIAASYNQVTTGSNNIAIGNDVAVASPTASNQLNIGNLIYGTGLNGTGSTLSTGNVGIGTTSPFATLSVNGNAFIGGNLTVNGLTATTSISAPYFTATNALATSTFAGGFQAAGTSGLTVLQNGNVGIGTTSPTNSLVVSSGASQLANFVQSAGTNNAYLQVSDGVDTVVFGTFTTGGFVGSLSNENFNIRTGNSNRVTVDTSGNVGIGTTNPAQKLDVAGNINTSAGSAYMYNGANVITASTTLSNYFFGGAGNLTMTGNQNTASGYQALLSNTTGSSNTATGYNALNRNTTGSNNTASGYQALLFNTTGYNNTASGLNALFSNTTGSGNTATGLNALNSNTTGSSNTASGLNALVSNTTGSSNTASGQGALYNNTTGSSNTASGQGALQNNTTGSSNTASGLNALVNNTSATSSVAVGYAAAYGPALYSNQGGTYLGYQSGYSAATGSNFNTLLGYQSGYDITTGANNIILGTEQTTATGVTTGSNNILIGTGVSAGLTPTASNQLNIGNLIFGTNVSTGSTLSSGNVGIGTSSPSESFSVSGQSYFASNVGINTNAPAQALQVNGTIRIVNATNNTRYQDVTVDGNGYVNFGNIAFAQNAGTGNGYFNITQVGPIVATTSGYFFSNSSNAVSGTQDTGIYRLAAGQLGIGNATVGNSSGTLIVGNIGIGTTTPGSLLSVQGIANFTTATSTFQSTGGINLASGCFAVNGTCVGGGGGGSGTVGSGTTGQFPYYAANGTTLTATSSLFLATNGNVGIGTTNPAQKLDVAGNINTSAGSAYMYNNANVITASTTLSNYFFGGAGNLTMTGNNTTAIGESALQMNTTGTYNTAIGFNTLFSNSTGYSNTVTGGNALYSNTTGYQNTANGMSALYNNVTGTANTATGYAALYNNNNGINNTANGMNALYANITGSQNTALGVSAGRYIAGGVSNNAASNNSLYLGYATQALANGDTNEIVIGASATGNGSNSVTLGNTSITKTILQDNVGIGTTTPSSTLTIQTPAGQTALTIASSTGATMLSVNANGSLTAKLNQLTSDYLVDSGSANINVGDLVAYVNGKAQKARSAIIAGTPVDANTVSSTQESAAALSSTSFVMAYYNVSTGFINAVVGTVSGTTITYGTPVALSASVYSGTNVSVAALSSTAFVISYQALNTFYAQAVVGTVSGTTITYGTPAALNAISSSYTPVAALSATSFVVAYLNNSTSYLNAVVSTVSGTTITPGTPAVMSSGTITTGNLSVAALSSSLFVVGYTVSGPTTYFVAGSVSGTTITAGTPFGAINSVASNNVSIATLSSTTFIVEYIPQTLYFNAVVGTVSGTTITIGSAYSFYAPTGSGNVLYPSVAAFSSTSFVATYVASAGYYVNAVVGTVSGTTVTFGQNVVLNNVASTVYAPPSAVAALSSSTFVMGYRNPSGYAEAFAAQSVTPSSNIIGMATTAASPGGVVTVASNGIVTGLSGLTAGSTYYDGLALGLSTTTSTYKVGLALSSSSILLNSSNGAGTDQFFGDAVFANNFRITEAPGAPQGLLFENQLGRQVMSIDEAGNLTVSGGISASSLNLTDISTLGQELLASAATSTATTTQNAFNFASGMATILNSRFNFNAFNALAASTSTPSVLSLYQGTTTPAITINASGKVGIGTTSPNRALTVSGDVGASQFVVPGASSASFTTGTTTLTAEIPSAVLTAGGNGIDLYKLSTFTLATVQSLAVSQAALSAQVSSLAARVAKLENGSISIASGSPVSFSSSTLASALSGFGILIQKGIAQFGTVVADQFVAATNANGASSAGSMTILAGNTVAQVNNAYAEPTTKVFVTFNAPVVGSWWVSDKAAGSFRVILSAPQAGDVSFDYFLVQTQGQIATSTPDGTFSQGSSAQSAGTSSGNTTTSISGPVITLLGANPMHIPVGGTFSEPGVTVTDNIDGTDPYITFINGIQQVVSSTTIDTSSPTTYIITYKATDQAGNSATALRSVIVGNPDGTVNLGPAPAPSSGGSTTGTSTATTSVTSTALSTASSTLPTSTTATSTPVSSDTTPPVVTLNGAAAMMLTVGGTFTDPGATATDKVDGNLTSKIKETGTVDTATVGLYTLTYSVTDAAGNTGSASRVVTVAAATSLPATTAAPATATTTPATTISSTSTSSTNASTATGTASSTPTTSTASSTPK